MLSSGRGVIIMGDDYMNTKAIEKELGLSPRDWTYLFDAVYWLRRGLENKLSYERECRRDLAIAKDALVSDNKNLQDQLALSEKVKEDTGEYRVDENGVKWWKMKEDKN